MNWINRYVDEPLLQGAAMLLRRWHVLTGQRPDTLEPVWNLISATFLMIATLFFMQGELLLLCQGALLALALPSAWQLLKRGEGGPYGVSDYKALRASAIGKRENEWALRMAVVVGSALLPFAHASDDSVTASFMLGASLWFALIAPLRFYLGAAEPPAPHEGDRFTRAALGSLS
ncbi:hypothetical protein QTL95_06245 [Rhizobium sp. S152]|uniref:hypothetical protein n=1 Tax=Rhizobium sp. S152 TaxID=3055038 RepID=UPI0025A947DF|nr:hypothetical protein [Rhizobium sp. S152]MDM9625486.1 hypothetical protein [Rhizobium sp. S152]